MKIYQTGNTIRIEGIFRSFDNILIDPDLIKVIIYDYKHTVLNTFILTAQNKLSTGVYFYEYITESKPQHLIYEYYGEINGLPSLKREQFKTAFV